MIRARNRQTLYGAVRRLGSAPIPGRRFNPNPDQSRSSGKTSCPQREPWLLEAAREQQRKTMGVTAGRKPATISNPGEFRGERAAWKDTRGALPSSCNETPRPLSNKQTGTAWIRPTEAGAVTPGHARNSSAPRSGSLGAGRDIRKHPARPTPSPLAVGE